MRYKRVIIQTKQDFKDRDRIQNRSLIFRSETISKNGAMLGKIQGLNKVRQYMVKTVCRLGTRRHAKPDMETVNAQNQIQGIPFFFL